MGLKKFFEPFIDDLDHVGLMEEETGTVILKADTFNYLWPFPNGFYLTRKFCFYGVGKIVGEGKDKKFIEIIPAKSDCIRQVPYVIEERTSYAFQTIKNGKIITYNEKGEVLSTT